MPTRVWGNPTAPEGDEARALIAQLEKKLRESR